MTVLKSTLTMDEALAKIAELEAKQVRATTLTLKVGEKGGVSIYGLGRFPVTLYGGQWERLIAHVPAIQQFLKDNASRLAVKA